MRTSSAETAIERLRALPAGRHYGASADSSCWVMVGRSLVDLSEWSMVPPAASLTFVWGTGGCALAFEGGSLRMGPGDWMWIDAGLAHRGENLPGSDFLTVFIADELVKQAALDLAPIGARSGPAPKDLADALTRLAVLLLDGQLDSSFERPALDVLLDHVGTTFEPRGDRADAGEPVQRARALMEAEPSSEVAVGEIADAVGLSRSELSRRFKAALRLTPVAYRKQLRLVAATRALLQGCSVSVAAHDAGFSDAAHFTRTFRDQYGTPPSRWVERLNRCVVRPAPRSGRKSVQAPPEHPV